MCRVWTLYCSLTSYLPTYVCMVGGWYCSRYLPATYSLCLSWICNRVASSFCLANGNLLNFLNDRIHGHWYLIYSENFYMVVVVGGGWWWWCLEGEAYTIQEIPIPIPIPTVCLFLTNITPNQVISFFFFGTHFQPHWWYFQASKVPISTYCKNVARNMHYNKTTSSFDYSFDLLHTPWLAS